MRECRYTRYADLREKNQNASRPDHDRVGFRGGLVDKTLPTRPLYPDRARCIADYSGINPGSSDPIVCAADHFFRKAGQ